MERFLTKIKTFWGLTYLMLTVFEWDLWKPVSFDPIKDTVDLEGKVAIVTGGNAGIGYSTVKFLARKGAKVYLAARNPEKAKEALDQLKGENLKGKVEFLHLDLLDPQNVKAAANKFLAQEDRLDILVNNAALLVQDVVAYHHGIADHMMTNHVGHFILTTTLLPLMKRTAATSTTAGRVVQVSSDSHIYAPETSRFRNLEDVNNEFPNHPAPYYGRYSNGKLANVLFAKELQRRLDKESVNMIVLSLHPGNANTFSYVSPFPRLSKFIMSFLFMTPDVGAYTTVFAAASPVPETDARYKGGYLRPIAQLSEATATACNPELGAELWETTERIVASFNI